LLHFLELSSGRSVHREHISSYFDRGKDRTHLLHALRKKKIRITAVGSDSKTVKKDA